MLFDLVTSIVLHFVDILWRFVSNFQNSQAVMVKIYINENNLVVHEKMNG